MNEMTYEQLKAAVISWADSRGILVSSDPKTQCLKFISEAGELADNIAVGNYEAAQDDIGDVLVTLILLSELIDTDLMTCLTDSYNVIRKRSGKMVNGIFVKDIV
jgi:NTP pyrophosphatase (non-canonical NTP hydrolase)